MTVSDVVTIIERAKKSCCSSSDPSYQEALQRKIEELVYTICLEYQIADLSWLDDDCELMVHLSKQAEELEQSI